MRNVAYFSAGPRAPKSDKENQMNNGNGWKLEIGYKGKHFHVFQDNWEVCIYEDLEARQRRFCVLEMSRLQSRHEDLDGPQGAKAAVLRRLIQLASPQQGDLCKKN
jgi:hypothetical protein